KPGSPAIITAAVPGTAADAVGGMVKFNPARIWSRPGLLLQNGVVYIGFGSIGDACPWHGWLIGYDAKTLAQTAVVNTTPDSAGGAIGQGESGVVGDGTYVYVATGNGSTKPDTSPPQLGEAFVKLDGNLKLVDWHIRGNYSMLDYADVDYGS